MVELKLTQVVETGQNITSDHFGGNVIVGVNTDNGTPTYQSELAHQELDIKNCEVSSRRARSDVSRWNGDQWIPAGSPCQFF